MFYIFSQAGNKTMKNISSFLIDMHRGFVVQIRWKYCIVYSEIYVDWSSVTEPQSTWSGQQDPLNCISLKQEDTFYIVLLPAWENNEIAWRYINTKCIDQQLNKLMGQMRFACCLWYVLLLPPSGIHLKKR